MSYQKSPPKYPSPWMSGSGDWASAYARARDFVSQLTLTEKVNLTTGVGYDSRNVEKRPHVLTMVIDGRENVVSARMGLSHDWDSGACVCKIRQWAFDSVSHERKYGPFFTKSL